MKCTWMQVSFDSHFDMLCFYSFYFCLFLYSDNQLMQLDNIHIRILDSLHFAMIHLQTMSLLASVHLCYYFYLEWYETDGQALRLFGGI